jgi:hypothetical protein
MAAVLGQSWGRFAILTLDSGQLFLLYSNHLEQSIDLCLLFILQLLVEL